MKVTHSRLDRLQKTLHKRKAAANSELPLLSPDLVRAALWAVGDPSRLPGMDAVAVDGATASAVAAIVDRVDLDGLALLLNELPERPDDLRRDLRTLNTTGFLKAAEYAAAFEALDEIARE